jgi:hypothetical protein
VLAALLFGALFQGGAELSFEIPGFSRDMVTTLQGLIVLFSGAMAQLAAPALARVCGWFKPSGAIAAAPGPGAAGGCGPDRWPAGQHAAGEHAADRLVRWQSQNQSHAFWQGVGVGG